MLPRGGSVGIFCEKQAIGVGHGLSLWSCALVCLEALQRCQIGGMGLHLVILLGRGSRSEYV